LSAYNNAYVFVSKRIEPGLVAQLRQFETSVSEYRAARDQQNSLRGLLGMAYVSTAVLLLLGAGWVGLTSATRVAEPIGRLVGAARRVAAGDLKARVSVGEERDEVDALASAFNRMTAQLETQRRDLVTAQEDAENRSSFIEAVLGGVSAGVMGLDHNGRITATNRSAVQLLGLAHADIIGRRLIDLAPEFTELLNQPSRAGEATAQRVDLMREGGSVNLSVRASPAVLGATSGSVERRGAPHRARNQKSVDADSTLGRTLAQEVFRRNHLRSGYVRQVHRYDPAASRRYWPHGR
jgi:two-component system nitrogen regulation sensor histidine kinase NtrY